MRKNFTHYSIKNVYNMLWLIPKKLWCILLLSVFAFQSYAQTNSVTGTVKDYEGEALPGVNVLEKGTTNGTITDIDGKYTLQIPPDATLVFSYIGYLSEEIAVSNRSVIDVELVPDITQLEEVVVIGYGTQRRQDLTGSIGIVDTETISKVATNDIRKAMQGQVAGISVQGGGEPGAAPIVKIRGVGSLTNNDPLYIVDGIQTPISQIPTSDVASIQVLKDAAAASIYGSRAANGVIIITTKRGEQGDLKISYNASYGWQRIANRYDVTDREGYQLLNNEAVRNAMPYNPDLTSLAPSNDPNSPDFIDDVDTDWQEEVLKTGTIMEHSLGFSGGTEKANYYVSLNYFDHEGTIVGNGPAYDRYSVRVNTDFKPGRFTFGESFQIAKEHFDFAGFLKDGNVIQDMVRAIPTMSVYDPSKVGGYGGSDGVLHRSLTNNVVGTNNILTNQSDRYRFIGNLYAGLEIIDGLEFKTSLSLERTDWRDTRDEPVYDLGTNFTNIIPKFYDWRGEGTTGSIENTLTFDDYFGKHHVTLLVGNTALRSKVINLNARAENIDVRYPDVISSGSQRFVDGGQVESRLNSYFGRFLYDFDGKYLLNFTIRRDGSSRFGANNRYGTFPSLSVGWKLHEESFMDQLAIVSQLKLRGSYGVLGNQEIGDYGYSTFVSPYAHAVFGGQLALGSTQVGYGNPDLKWETTKTTNIAFDLALFDDRLTFTTEYYKSKTEDLLVLKPIPPSTGVYPGDEPYFNAATLQNSGLEFILGYNKVEGDFTYSVSANFSTLKNEVVSLGGGEPINGIISRTEEGGEVGEFYGYVIDRIFQSQEEVNALNADAPDGFYQEVNTGAGDFKFKDIDNDGHITEADRTYLGSAIPKYYFGGNLSAGYKNFDLSILLQGHAGNKVFDAVRASLEASAGYQNYSTRMLDRWTPDNPGNTIPRVIIGDPNINGRASDRWLESGSYLRITNIQLGYTFSPALLERLFISSLRFYVAGQNLLTFTKYEGLDPDFGNDGLFNRGVDHADAPLKNFNAFTGGLPNPRTFLLGLQVQF